MNVLIVVTHLLGTGHLSRALTLGRAFGAAGHQVTVASGGFPAPQLSVEGIDFVQLPPLRSDGVDFARLLDAQGQVASPDYLHRRCAMLVELLAEYKPDVVITELYPFGRRSLRSEFNTMLDAARSAKERPLVLASIRDILAPPSKPKKATEADQVVAEYYDGVLVHSDPKATTLDVSWPVSDCLKSKLHYTGYVAPPSPLPHSQRCGHDEILVSAGGGNVGDTLFATAIEAAKLLPEHRWRILIGGPDAAGRISALRDPASSAILEPARPDFRQMLPLAAASVSMCGYNTALDLLQAGTPGVFVPFDAGKEVEQGLRANSLKSLAGFDVVPTAELSPQRLCSALSAVLTAPRRNTRDFAFDGAARSVEIAAKLLGERQ